jgi:lipoate-protein ligase A
MASSHDPYLNLGKILDLASSTPSEGKTLYIWRNSPVVSIGRHQNPHKECNLSYMQANDVKLARRPIGGGAAYQDLGDTGWAFLEPRTDAKTNLAILTGTFDYLGLHSSLEKDGSLNIANRQVVKSSVVPLGKQVMQHGVFHVNPNSKSLSGCLSRPKPGAMPSLSDINAMVNHEALCEALIHAFKGTLKNATVKYLGPKAMMDEQATMKHFRELSSPSWIFGKSFKEAKECVSKDFGFGTFDVSVKVEGSRMKEALVSSDCLLVDVVEKFEACVNRFAKSALPVRYLGREYIESLKTPQEQEMAEALITWIVPEMKKFNIK